MWQKMKPVEPKNSPCPLCGQKHKEAPPDMIIGVGFGYAGVQKDGKEIWREQINNNGDTEYWTVAQAEVEASKDPDHDWRIILDAPLSYSEYQRQDGKWLLVKTGLGFA